jgi:hypothetical protein
MFIEIGSSPSFITSAICPKSLNSLLLSFHFFSFQIQSFPQRQSGKTLKNRDDQNFDAMIAVMGDAFDNMMRCGVSRV